MSRIFARTHRPALAAIIALAAAAGLAQAQSASERRDTSTSIVVTNGQTVKVETVNGEIKLVTLNGETVPTPRLERQGQTLIVKDSTGKEIARVSLGNDDDDGAGRVDAAARRAEAEGRRAELQARAAERQAQELERARERAMAAADRVRDQIRTHVSGTTNRSTQRVMLGVTPEEPTEGLAAQLGVKSEEVTVLTTINDGMPAAKAGLKRFDVIVAIDGKTPAGPEDLRRVLRERKDGDELKLSIIRAGQKQDITVKLEAVAEEPEDDESIMSDEDLKGLEESLKDLPRGIEESVRRSLEQGQGRVHLNIGPGRHGMVVAPVPPYPGMPPAPPRGGAMVLMDESHSERLDSRLDALESQLDGLDSRFDALESSIERIQELLERLAESRGRNP
jgi:hypothetical protein